MLMKETKGVKISWSQTTNIISVPSSPPIVYIFNEILVKTEKFYTYRLILKFTGKHKIKVKINSEKEMQSWKT